MKLLYFIITHDLIQKAVKLETSQLAKRRLKETSGAPEMMIDELVLDDAYANALTFKNLFDEAHAELMMKIPANNLAATQTDMNSIHEANQNYREDTDFALFINIDDHFPSQYTKTIDIKIQNFFMDYICYRWLETKSPNDAKSYFSRIEKTQDDILKLLNRRDRPMRRLPGFP